ncbi:putative polygalacturonate 4-alpha-galacturonosyltransferase [Dioscorea sansibarensis]
MVFRLRVLRSLGAVLLVVSFVAVMFISLVRSDVSDTDPRMFSDNTVGRDFKGYRRPLDCPNCNGEENVDITTTYTDASGNVQIYKVKSNDLSSSWVWASSADEDLTRYIGVQEQKGFSEEIVSRSQHGDVLLSDKEQRTNPVDPVKLKRQILRQKRREQRVAELTEVSDDAEFQMQAAAIQRSRQFKNINRGKYSIWRREYQSPNSDSTLKLMKDQIIMAKVYASIARLKKNFELADSLMGYIRQNQMVIGDANSDAELHWSAPHQAKFMGHLLSQAKDMLYECDDVARKLRVMIQSTEEHINSLKKQSTFLIQHAAKTTPRPLHCLPLQLTTDYYFYNYGNKEMADKGKLVDPSLYHYAIFSDNVLATSVVVNSTAAHAKEPEKHVFHIVTDKLNFAAMKMWFILHPPSHATVDVENIDSFTWLNSSYCSVLRQLESSRLKEYYFKAHHPSSLSAGNENLKYRNPKYLSMLNHLRFYMPEVYPKLEKILFLDDDVVVQKDLTPLWSIDMNGMVNGAVETCKESFHRFDTYLNFSNPKISQNFDPQACGWAFGMNMFNLKEWTKRNITGIYHYWQDLNEDRTLWKLGSLPPGLITFYNLTYPLDRNWHVLGLGYDPAINPTEIENAAVIHYNGNYKPWLDLAISKYKPYWSKYVMPDNPYLQFCNINP